MGITKAGRALARRLAPDPAALTQAHLAEKLGVTQQAISAWTRGISRPEEERRPLIEKLTGVVASDWDRDDAADESGERGALEDTG